MKIFNTLTKQLEPLPSPDEQKKLNMFVCGPTVYDYIHIGNARTFVMFDVVAKYLRYRGYDVNYIQNITDIDNKIIEETTKFAEKRIIKPGIEIDNKTEVNSGLKQNEEIIFYGQSLLENNSRIRIMNTVTVLTKEDIIK